MGGLEYFLKQNQAERKPVFYPASSRFADEEGRPVMWQIRAVNGRMDEALRLSATKRVPAEGRKNVYYPEVDYGLYLAKLAAASTVYPNLKDAVLQESYGVMGEEALLGEMLSAGEYQQYLRQVQIVNGFEDSSEEQLEETAKNF